MKRCSSLFFLFFFLYLLFSPERALSAASDGLLLWYRSVLPSLFPFMLLCSLALRLGLLDCWIRKLYRPFHLLTGCSPYGAFAILTGFLCGFPMGIKITRDLKKQKKIGSYEATWLMGFVNNLSPAFLISYLAYDQLKLPSWKYLFLANILGASFIYGMITSFSFRRKHGQFEIPAAMAENNGIIEVFPVIDECINDTLSSILRLGAYIMTFTVIQDALKLILPSDQPLFFLLLSSMEVTNGIRMLASSGFSFFTRFLLINSLCTFGGFCALAQSAGIAKMDSASLLHYIKSRVYITLLSVLLSCGSILLSVFL